MRSAVLPAWLAVLTFWGGPAPLEARDAVRRIPGVAGPSAEPAAPPPTAPVREPVPGPRTVVIPTGGAAVAGSETGPATARDPDRMGLSVTINRAKVIRLPERAQTVVVGNPAIADLTLQKNGIVIVTGKSYGVTNLLALDSAGTMLAESLVNVVPQTDGTVVVQRAFERYSYSCNPNCQPSVNLGDNNAYFNDARSQADAHNQFAGSR